MIISKPINKFKIFGSKAQQGKYLPTMFGTGKIISKDDYFKIANDNFEFGLESLNGCTTMRDISNVLFYLSSSLGYLYQMGIPEWNQYQQYVKNSIVQYKGKVYISLTEHLTSEEPEEVTCKDTMFTVHSHSNNHCGHHNHGCGCGCGDVIIQVPTPECPAPEAPVATPDVDTDNWKLLVVSPEALEKILEDMQSKIDEKFEELEKVIEDNKSDLEDQIKQVKQDLEDALKEVKDELTKELEKAKAELTDAIKDVEKALEDSIEKLEETNKANITDIEADKDFATFTYTKVDGSKVTVELREEHITDVRVKGDELVVEINKEEKFKLPVAKIKDAMATVADTIVVKNAHNQVLAEAKVLQVR